MLSVVAGWASLQYLPSFIERLIEKRTSFGADIREFDLKLLSGTMDIHDSALNNPDSFSDSSFLDLNRFKFKLAPSSFIANKRLIIEDLSIHIDTLTYVINEGQESNLAVFIETLNETSEEKDGEETLLQVGSWQLYIKSLVLRLDKVVVSDFSGIRSRKQEVETDISLNLSNISETTEIVEPLIEELSRFGLSEVAEALANSLIEHEASKGVRADYLGNFKHKTGIGGSFSDENNNVIQQKAERAITDANLAAEKLKKLVESLKTENIGHFD